MNQKEQIQERVRQQVIDPEIGVNVVDLGLIYEIRPEEDRVVIKMTLTSPGCPYGDKLIRDVKGAAQAGEERSVEVELVWDPPWSKERMSQAARDHLMFFGAF